MRYLIICIGLFVTLSCCSNEINEAENLKKSEVVKSLRFYKKSILKNIGKNINNEWTYYSGGSEIDDTKEYINSLAQLGDNKSSLTLSKSDVNATCSEIDYRTFHLCVEARFFKPSAKIYFDTGSDDENEVDVFNNGKLNASLDFVSLHLPWRFGRSEHFDSFSWGPNLGLGISSAIGDSGDGGSSSAPIILISFGLLLEYHPDEKGTSFGLEVGRVHARSTDEGLIDRTDNANYVGLQLNIPINSRLFKSD